MTSSIHQTECAISIYLPGFYGGGAENALVRLANYWFENGRSVRFIVNRDEGPVRKRLLNGIPVYELGRKQSFLAISRLGKIIGRNGPEVLVTALVSPNIAGFLAARLFAPSVPVISLIRSHASTELSAMPWWKRHPFRLLLQNVYGRTDAIGCVSQSLSDDMANFLGTHTHDRIATTFNPVPLHENRDLRTPDDWPSNFQKTIVTAGRLIPQKGHDRLIRALAGVPDASTGLIVLGEGPSRDYLTSLAADLGVGERVRLLGYKSAPEPYLSNADIFALTSDFEGFPNVIAEALSLGKTVVATDAPGGASEILGQGKYGYLVPLGDSAALKNALLTALQQPINPEIAIARANDFSSKAVSSRYDRLISLAVTTRQNSRPEKVRER